MKHRPAPQLVAITESPEVGWNGASLTQFLGTTPYQSLPCVRQHEQAHGRTATGLAANFIGRLPTVPGQTVGSVLRRYELQWPEDDRADRLKMYIYAIGRLARNAAQHGLRGLVPEFSLYLAREPHQLAPAAPATQSVAYAVVADIPGVPLDEIPAGQRDPQLIQALGDTLLDYYTLRGDPDEPHLLTDDISGLRQYMYDPAPRRTQLCDIDPTRLYLATPSRPGHTDFEISHVMEWHTPAEWP